MEKGLETAKNLKREDKQGKKRKENRNVFPSSKVLNRTETKTEAQWPGMQRGHQSPPQNKFAKKRRSEFRFGPVAAGCGAGCGGRGRKRYAKRKKKEVSGEVPVSRGLGGKS